MHLNDKPVFPTVWDGEAQCLPLPLRVRVAPSGDNRSETHSPNLHVVHEPLYIAGLVATVIDAVPIAAHHGANNQRLAGDEAIPRDADVLKKTARRTTIGFRPFVTTVHLVDTGALHSARDGISVAARIPLPCPRHRIYIRISFKTAIVEQRLRAICWRLRW
jgi:hypothetical protein